MVQETSVWEEALPATGDNASNHLAEATVEKETDVIKEVVATTDLSIHTQSPDKLVSGTVTNADGKPLPGVLVIVKGMTTGSVTDMNGKYSLNIPDQAILQFSFVGVSTQEIVVGNQQVINVVMVSESPTNEEIKVVASGLMNKGIDNPLWIVDGKEVDNLDRLDPNNLKSIDILKEASATALYGEKGVNGVIIVTTKTGAATVGKPVSGTVTNADGKPLPGVLVIVKGTATGSVTDMNGKYSLNIPDQAILQFSFVGVSTQEIVVGNQQVINVVMVSESPTNDEIKVVASGLMNKGIDNLLLIVDGKEFDKELNTISPDRIESITVLKDQSAVTVYGEKGKNGVIVITTKK